MDFKTYFNSNNEPTIKTFTGNNSIELSYTGSDVVKGYIHAERDNKNNKIYRVVRVSVEPKGSGYGKRLYIELLRLVTRQGNYLAPAVNSTSDSASNIWRRLYADNNIEKTHLSPNDWPESPRNNNLLKKYPDLRFRDPNTYPPSTDTEFWTFNSAYRFKN